MRKKLSIQAKFSLVFVLTLVLATIAFIIGLSTLRTQVLHNEAAAVADQVIAFRAWVANSGMIWVNKLAPEFPDYLVKTDVEHGSYYGKNPALATRELSVIANKTASRATFLVTSDEYRQVANRPDDFENMAIKSFKADNSLKFKDGFDDGMYRYTRPIFVVESCLKCHGDPNDAPPELIVKYGGQKAFGYKVGDVRGIISVKLPILSWQDLLPIFSNPIAIILIICAFLLNFLFIQRIIIRRLVNLTNDASEIAKGNLAKSLKYSVPKESNDEIDHVCHSVNLLKKSMDILIKRSNKL